MGAGAAAIALTYKITGDLRAEAERLLRVEESIQGAINNQLVGQREGLANLQKEREELQKNREFGRNLNSSSIDDLTRQRASLEKLQNLTPKVLPVIENGKVVSKVNEDFEKNSERLKAFDAQIDQLRQQNIKRDNDAYNQSAINAEKSRQNRLESEKRYQDKLVEYNKKRNEDIDKAKNKIKELEKQYLSTFDNLYAKANSSNSFVAIFTEADKALTELRKNLAGLSPELQAQAIALQTKITSNALFSAKLDNDLSSFNLRDEAAKFRNFKPQFDPSQADEMARRNVGRGNFFPNFGGTYGSDLANRAGGFDKLTDKQKRDIYEVETLSNNIRSTVENGGKFGELNQKSLISKLASERLALANPNENLSFQEKLQKELDIVNKAKLGATNKEQVDAANRRIVALTSVDPSKLNDRERAQAAVAREAVAEQQDKFQQEALAVDKEKLKVEKELTAEIKKLREQAEKEGKAGLDKLLVEVKDAQTTKSTVTRANPSDTASAMDLGGAGFQLQLNQRPKQK